jgi:energy-coupling factor transport system ATP-binding protein
MIEVREVTVELSGRPVPVLDAVSFVIAPGERVALLGGNGSGKTTLARLLNGIHVPTRGAVQVDGTDTRVATTLPQVRRTVGLLFQDPDDQFVTTTVEREIAFALENQRLPAGEIRHRVEALLAQFDLADRRRAAPHEMSGGEKARLALACVWAMRPRYLVLDETESLLDRRGRERLGAALAALPPETAIVHVTTEAERAARCERVLVLHAGRLEADGPADTIWRDLPATAVARTGLPLAWRISARLVACGRIAQATSSEHGLVAAFVGMADRGIEGPTGGMASTPEER